MVDKKIENDDEEADLVLEAKKDAKVDAKGAAKKVIEEEDFDDADELGEDDIDEIEEE